MRSVIEPLETIAINVNSIPVGQSAHQYPYICVHTSGFFARNAPCNSKGYILVTERQDCSRVRHGTFFDFALPMFPCFKILIFLRTERPLQIHCQHSFPTYCKPLIKHNHSEVNQIGVDSSPGGSPNRLLGLCTHTDCT